MGEEFDVETTLEPEVVETPSTPDAEPVETSDAEKEQQKIIAEHAFKRREAERKAAELERKVQELSRPTQQDRPVVPDLKDPFTLNEQQLADQLKERDAAVQRAAEWDAQQRANNEQRLSLEAERNRQQQEALAKSIKDYSGRAVQLGMKPEELEQAGTLVGRFGLPDDVVKMILDDDQGPLITKYLANNIQELDSLAGLTAFQAGIRIATTIKQKAAALKPKVSSAPAPTTQVRGVGMVPKDYGPEGAIYE